MRRILVTVTEILLLDIPRSALDISLGLDTFRSPIFVITSPALMPAFSAADLNPQDRLRPDYYLMGGITELNANLRSNVSVGGPSIMNIALDLRLVDTRTSNVADVISYQRQILVSDWAQEPIQLAVRSIIERAVLEMVTRLYAAPEAVCGSPVSPSAAPAPNVSFAPRPDRDNPRAHTATAAASPPLRAPSAPPWSCRRR